MARRVPGPDRAAHRRAARRGRAARRSSPWPGRSTRSGTASGRGSPSVTSGSSLVPVPVPVPPTPDGRSRAVGAVAVGVAAALGAVAGWALDRRWLTDDHDGAADDDHDDPASGAAGDGAGLTLPPGEERVVVTDDGAELAVTILQPEGARRGRFRRRRSGPATVVLVHGWTNTRAVWGPVARRLLAAGHPVIAYDQRGHGASTFGPEAPTVDRLGDDLATVLDQLDVREAVLVGHSMGGFAVMAWAVDHLDDLHDRARGLVLVGTAAHGVGFGSLDQLASKVVGGRLLSWMLARPRLGLLLVRGAVGCDPQHRDLAITRDLFLSTKPAVRTACYLLCTQMDLRAGLPSIDLPTVVLAGGRDSVTPARLGRIIADLTPDARFELFPDAGHLLLLEEVDAVVAAATRLAGNPDGDPDAVAGGDADDDVSVASVTDRT